MSDDLEQLYQDLILEHYRNPRHAEEISEEDADVEKLNPTCGDRVRLTLTVCDQKITACVHDSKGCAVARASASLMASALQSGTVEEARAKTAAFLRLMETGDVDADLGDILALKQVRDFPLRVRCATLPWLAMEEALTNYSHEP